MRDHHLADWKNYPILHCGIKLRRETSLIGNIYNIIVDAVLPVWVCLEDLVRGFKKKDGVGLKSGREGKDGSPITTVGDDEEGSILPGLMDPIKSLYPFDSLSQSSARSLSR
jgi:hypothetical protein